MNMRLFQLIAIGVFLAATSQSSFAQTAAPADTAQNSDASQRVRIQVREAAAALKAAQYERARSLMLDAWQVRPTWDVAMFLAQAEMELRLYRDAAEHLDYAIANLPAVESEKLLQTLQQAFAEAKAHVGQLRIASNRDGAEVLIDGQVVGKSPLPNALFVEPGQHRIEVRQAGVSTTRDVELAANGSLETALDLPVANAPTAPTNNTTPPPWTPSNPTTERDAHRSIVPVVVGGAVFAVALASAIGFKLDETSQRDDADSLQRTLGPYACAGSASQSETCRQLKDAGKSADADRKWFIASTVVAGTAAVATSLYWLWPRSKAKESNGNSIDVQGAVTPQGISASVSGRF